MMSYRRWKSAIKYSRCTKENIKKQRTDIFNLKKENLEDMDHRNNNEEKINSLFSVDKFFYCISNI